MMRHAIFFWKNILLISMIQFSSFQFQQVDIITIFNTNLLFSVYYTQMRNGSSQCFRKALKSNLCSSLDILSSEAELRVFFSRKSSICWALKQSWGFISRAKQRFWALKQSWGFTFFEKSSFLSSEAELRVFSREKAAFWALKQSSEFISPWSRVEGLFLEKKQRF